MIETQSLSISRHAGRALASYSILARAGIGAAVVLVLLVLPYLVYPPIALDILAWALFAIALDLLLGYAGLLSFGHAAFWGTSAYVTGYVAIKTGMPFIFAVLAGAITAMVIAIPIGILSVRRAGIYFAMVTLAFAQLIYFIANQWRSVTGGENGLIGVPRSVFGLTQVEADPFYFYYAALPVAVLGAWAAWRIVNSPFGQVLIATRDNGARAEALGYHANWYRVVTFSLSAGLAGIAGGLFAVSHGFVSLQEVHWSTSGHVVLITVLGGIGTLWGGVLGAGVLVILEDWLASAGFEGIGLVTGLVFIVIVLAFRRGIWGTARYLWSRRRHHD